MRDSMVFYRSFWEALKMLPLEDKQKATDAIIEYGLNGVEPEVDGIPLAMFLMARPQIDANASRYENGKRGGRPKAAETEKPLVLENDEIKKPMVLENTEAEKPMVLEIDEIEKPNVNENVNVNVNENVESNTRASARAHTPPSLDDVKAYCKERGGKVDAERWYDFYASKGWMIGKNKMKDWKAAVRRWESDAQARAPDDVKRFGFEQRKYDDNFYNGLVKSFDNWDSISKSFDDD